MTAYISFSSRTQSGVVATDSDVDETTTCALELKARLLCVTKFIQQVQQLCSDAEFVSAFMRLTKLRRTIQKIQKNIIITGPLKRG